MILLELSAGTYNEHDITVDKNLTIKGPEIIGNGQPTTIIDAGQSGKVFNMPEGDTVTLQNLIIQNGNTTSDTGNSLRWWNL